MTIAMPRVVQTPSPNYSPTPISHDLFVLHDQEGHTLPSVAWLCDPRAQASAHMCLSEDGLTIYQLVPLSMKAWAQCAFNSRAISLEMPGFAAQGFSDDLLRAAALIAAWCCRAYAIPVVWAQGGQGRGLCCHHDLGSAGGGHQDIAAVGGAAWQKFMGFVKEAFDAFGNAPLPPFALHGLPNPALAELPPAATPEPSHGGAARNEQFDTARSHSTGSGYPHGSVADLQMRLNWEGAAPKLIVDGFAGDVTRAALKAFQTKHGLDADGVAGPLTWRELGVAAHA